MQNWVQKNKYEGRLRVPTLQYAEMRELYVSILFKFLFLTVLFTYDSRIFPAKRMRVQALKHLQYFNLKLKHSLNVKSMRSKRIYKIIMFSADSCNLVGF